MLKNLVFDLGNVLVEFKPIEYLTRIGLDNSHAKKLTEIIFKDSRWNEFDRGTITINEYISQLKYEHPEEIDNFDKIFSEQWISNMFRLKDSTISFLFEAAKHYNIYLLSNISYDVLSYIKTLDFYKFVKGGTYSCLIQHCKPEPEIYKTFIKENNLIPSECLFLDDLPENIEAAIKLGIPSMIFTDATISNLSKQLI